MALILLILLLAIILGGLGFAVHILWWIALVVFVIWLLGFLIRVGEGGGRRRWYRWLPVPGRTCPDLTARRLRALARVIRPPASRRAIVITGAERAP